MARSEMGLLVYHHNDLKTIELNIGSMLKTPVHPIWVLSTNGRVAVIFTSNQDLIKTHQSEKRFHLNFYPASTATGTKQTQITVDANVTIKDEGLDEDDDGTQLSQCTMTAYARPFF